MAFAHVDAEPRRVPQQDVIELRTQHVVRVRPAARVLAEEEAPRRALLAPHEGAAGLADEARRLDGRRHAERIEDRQGRRQQRLADVVARKVILLEQQDPDAGSAPEIPRRSSRPDRRRSR